MTPPSKDDRIAFIRDKMMHDTWRRGDSKRLAEAWGLSLRHVEHDAAEASRLVHSLWDREGAKAMVRDLLEATIRRADQEEGHAKAAMVMLEAAKFISKSAGLDAQAKGAPTTAGGSDEGEVPFGFVRDEEGNGLQ